jgi:hypothetical protein
VKETFWKLKTSVKHNLVKWTNYLKTEGAHADTTIHVNRRIYEQSVTEKMFQVDIMI